MPLHGEAPFLVVPSPGDAPFVAPGSSSPWFPVVLAAPPGTEAVGRQLGTRIHPLVCVHGAHLQGGGLHAQGVAIVPAHLLRSALGDDRVLSDAEVELLATSAWTRLHPAA